MIKRLFQQIKNSRKLLAISVLFGCIGGVALIAEAHYVASIVDQVFLHGSALAEVKLLLGVLLAIIVVRALLHMMSDYMASRLAQGIKSELRLRLIGKIAELGPQYSKGERSGELVSTLYEGVEQLESYLAKYVPQIVLSVFVPFAVFIVVLGQDGLSALVYAITLPLLVLFMILIGKFTKDRTDRQFKLLGRLGGHFQEILRGIETLKIFNRSKDQLRIIGSISEEHRRSTMATLKLAFLSAFVMELFATISTAVIAVFLGLRLIEGQLNFYHAFLILLLTPEFYAPIRALGTQFHAGMNGASAATRIFQILDTEPQGYTERADAKQVQPAANGGYTIEFRSVTLQYEKDAAPALQEVSFKLEAGRTLAIVGATGAGKSTVLELLQGFIKPSGGTIIINGVELKELSIEQWRQKLTTVSQHVHLFHGTIRENIAIGLEHVTDEQLWQALRRASADQFVAELPLGLETKLTDQIMLSGGQKQRLVLARALLREDSPIVLLDEATTGLDVYNEQYVMNELQQCLAGKSAIIVAHHLQTIAAVDQIIVMEKGRIIEAGSPQQLAANQGKFAAMLAAMRADELRAGDARAGSLQARDVQVDDMRASDMQIKGGQAGRALSDRVKMEQRNQRAANQALRLEAVRERVVLAGEACTAEQEAFSFGQLWRASRRLMKFLAAHKLLVGFAILLSFLTIAASIGLMGTSGYLIAKAALQPENVLMLYIPIVGVRFFGISRGVLRYLERLASHNVTFKVLHRLRLWLYERIEPKGIVLLQRKRGGDLLGSIISDIEQLQNFYLRLFAPPVVFAMTVVLAVVFISLQHPVLGIALLILLLCAGLGLPYGSYRVSRQSGDKLVHARTRLYEETLDMLRGLATLQQYGKLKHQQAVLEQVQHQLNQQQLKEQRRLAISNGLMTLVTQLGMWVLLLLAIPLVANGTIAPYMLPAILLITLASFEATAPLPQAFALSSSVTMSANRLFQLAEGDEAAKGQQQAAASLDAQAQAQANTVEVANMNEERQPQAWSCELWQIDFQYEPTEPIVLQNISLSLAAGKQVAVVGESGAGKSSMLQLLLKLRPLQSGTITINGRSYEALDEGQVRSHFAVVTQQVQLFNATIAENLRLGNREASTEQLREAARLAEIDDFIMSLPQGYDTMIGEYGAKLSGGERQRLALARALLKPSSALLFDEPATGLDQLTQKAFRSNLQQVLKDRALLWITHQLADTVEMDEIIVLHQGRIVERGRHEGLLQQKGYYSQLWERRFKMPNFDDDVTSL